MDTRIFVKSGKCLHEYFSYCGAKQLRRKIVIPPLSSLTLLDTRKFLRRKVPIRSSSVKWDKKFFTRSRDNPSFTSPRTSYPKNLSIPVFFQNQEQFFYEFIPCCKMKQIWRKIVKAHLSFLKFLDLRVFLKNRKVPLRSSSVMWENNFSTGSHDTPSFLHPPCHIQNVRRYQIFHKPGKGSLTNLLGTVRQNNFDGKSW